MFVINGVKETIQCSLLLHLILLQKKWKLSF